MPEQEAQTFLVGQAEDRLPPHGETVGHIVDRLRSEIQRLTYAPGSRLVENELTKRFAVSRGPVREALRRLAAEGMIEHTPNRGAVVRRLSRQEVRELFEIRTELEALAARLAASSDDEAKQRQFARAIAPIFETEPRVASSYMEENAGFHAAISELAGNHQLQELVRRLQLPQLMSQVSSALDAAVLGASVREHRKLAAAILARDAKEADSALRAHLGRAAKLALETLGD
ncbi:MAG: GntR family transcriptional regulator [Roseiarcus sp.]